MKLILKLSGKTLEDREVRTSLARQIGVLVREGDQIVLVHGGGKQLSLYCREAGLAVRQKAGRRITDGPTLEAAKKVFASLNMDLTAALLSVGVKACGLTAFDGGLTRSYRRPPIVVPGEDPEVPIDFGFVGEIDQVDPGLLTALWTKGCLPVVACLCCSPEGQILNINADTLAAELAVSVEADRVISLSDIDGIYRDPADPRSVISDLTLTEARRWLDEGVFLEGMIPKVQTAIRLIERGVPSFQILNGAVPDVLLLSRQEPVGTVLRP